MTNVIAFKVRPVAPLWAPRRACPRSWLRSVRSEQTKSRQTRQSRRPCCRHLKAILALRKCAV